MIIVARTPPEEAARLKAAGYRVFRLPGCRFTPANATVIFLEADPSGLLTPPLCPYCGRFMGDPESFYEDGAHVLRYQCSGCGAKEIHTRFPPKREDE